MPRLTALLPLVALVGGCGDDRELLGSPERPLRVLLFQEEGADVGWFHASTPVAAQTFTAVGRDRGWDTAIAASSTGVFTPDVLATFDVVVYLLSSGTVLDPAERDALVGFIADGNGYVGVHSASFTDPDWQWYIDLVGARFATEDDALHLGTVRVDRPGVALLAPLPTRWSRIDQWYVFLTPPEDNPNLELLLSLDETSLPASYPEVLAVGYHPIAWRQQYGGGRSFYTAMGHTVESYAEPAFVTLVADAIEWAGGPSRHAADQAD